MRRVLDGLMLGTRQMCIQGTFSLIDRRLYLGVEPLLLVLKVHGDVDLALVSLSFFFF